MNHDEMYDDETDNDIEHIFPRHISDESAVVLCDFLAELLLFAENRYFTQLRRCHEAHSPPVDPDHPWRNLNSN